MTPEHKELRDRLAAVRGLPTCTRWADGFAESIIMQIDKGRTISEKQIYVCKRILNENSEEAQKDLANWENEYNEKHKAEAQKLAIYYRSQAQGYYGDVTRDISNNVVPNRAKYLRMRNNKYAKKILAELERTPRFTTDDSVIPNSKFLDGYSFNSSMMATMDNRYPDMKERSNFKKRGGVILGVDDKILSSAKGSKRYLVLPLGSVHTYWVEERFLKMKKKVK